VCTIALTEVLFFFLLPQKQIFITVFAEVLSFLYYSTSELPCHKIVP